MRAASGRHPKKLGGRLDRHTGEVVDLAVERLARHPGTFAQDLPKLRAIHDEAYKSGRLDKVEAKQNRAAVRRIDNALSKGRAEGAVHAANEYIKLQQPILEAMEWLSSSCPSAWRWRVRSRSRASTWALRLRATRGLDPRGEGR